MLLMCHCLSSHTVYLIVNLRGSGWKTPSGVLGMERHRALAPLITLLAIATGATLFATGWTLASPAVADTRPVAAEEIVRDFYAAINLGIRTGDTTSLDNIVLE